jgi:transposase
MVCLDARQAQRALDMRANKTDANDADGLAHLVRAGWYKEVRVKSRDAMLSKAVSAARRQLLDISTNLSNQVRGLMKTFGLVVPKGKGRIFEAAGSSMRNTPWQLSSYRFWKLGAPSATVPPSSTGSCSVRCATTRIADGS